MGNAVKSFINKGGYTWTADANKRFSGLTLSDIKKHRTSQTPTPHRNSLA